MSARETNTRGRGQSPRERFQSEFSDSASAATDHISHLDFRSCCKDVWVVVGFPCLSALTAVFGEFHCCRPQRVWLCPPASPWGPNLQFQLSWPAIRSDWSWAQRLHPPIPANEDPLTFLSCFKSLELCDFLIFHAVKTYCLQKRFHLHQGFNAILIPINSCYVANQSD